MHHVAGVDDDHRALGIRIAVRSDHETTVGEDIHRSPDDVAGHHLHPHVLTDRHKSAPVLVVVVVAQFRKRSE